MYSCLLFLCNSIKPYDFSIHIYKRKCIWELTKISVKSYYLNFSCSENGHDIIPHLNICTPAFSTASFFVNLCTYFPLNLKLSSFQDCPELISRLPNIKSMASSCPFSKGDQVKLVTFLNGNPSLPPPRLSPSSIPNVMWPLPLQWRVQHIESRGTQVLKFPQMEFDVRKFCFLVDPPLQI